MDENDEYWEYFQLSLASEPDGYVGVNIQVSEQTNARFVVAVINSYGQFVQCESGETCYIHINQDEWDDYQTVYVNALIDDNRAGGSGTIKVSAESGDPDYNGREREVSVTEYDRVGAAMLFPDGYPGWISEGGQASFSVKLAVEPYADVSVAVSSSHGDITVSPESLTFTASNYSGKQWVTLRAKEDNIAQTAQATISLAASSSGDSDYDDLSGSFTITEQENDTARFVLSNFHSSLTITEGGSHTYSVRLNSEPSANVTVTVSSNHSDIRVNQANTASLTFTPTDYGTAQNVTVSAAEDDTDYTSETATLSHSVSGASEYSGQSISNVAVTSRDNDTEVIVDADPDTEGNQTALTVREGGSASYTVKLNIAPTANVTVAIAEGTGSNDDTSIRVTSPSNKTLTFTPQNWNNAQTVRIQANSDSDAVNGVRTINHTASGAAEFAGKTESLTATGQDSQAAVVIDADADRSGNQTSVSVNEGGGATYSVSLAAKPAANVTVTPSVSGDDSFSVAPASLTFTPDDYGTAQTLTVSAALDTDLDNGSATVAHTASSAGDAHSGYDGVPARNLTATEIDKTGKVEILDAADTTKKITTLGVPEGGSATYKVKLNVPPTGSVTVRLALQSTSGDSPGDRDITASPTTLYFNTGNWSQAQTVTVRAAQDDDYTIGSRAISHTASGGGFNVTTPVVLTASEVDDEASFLFTNADGDAIAGLTVPEGGSADYYVALSTPPTAAVQVNLAATGDISVSPSLVIFTTTNWDTAQKVTASAAEEAPAQPSATNKDNTVNEEETITHTAASGDAVYNGKTIALAATGQDNDPGIVIRNAADDAYVTGLDVREGSSAAYTVKLNSPPLTGDVTVTITGKTTVPGNDPDITVDTDAITAGDQNTLTFTAANWNTARTVTVRAANDSSVRKCVPERVFTHAADGGDFSLAPEALLTATELDNDSRHIVLCSVSGNSAVSSLVVPEGVGAPYSVRLNLRPSGNVTVSLSAAASGDADITVSPASLTFTTENWSVPQSATLWAAEDADLVSGYRNVNHTASGHSSATLLAVEQDNDTESGKTNSISAYDSTATTVLLQIVKGDPKLSYSYTSPLGCRGAGAGATSFHVFGPLAPDTEYTFTLYRSASCAGDRAVVTSNPVTTKQVTLASSNVTASGATLSVSGWTPTKDGLTRDGDWHYRADKGPDAAACSAGQTGNSAALTGLDSATTYIYTMYQDSDCATSIEVFPSFTTSGQAMTVTTGATTAALAIPNYTSTWYYKHDGVNCRPASGGATGYVTGLARNTEYLFKAYSNGGCSTEIASKRASTQNPALAVSRVGRTKATLTLSNWVLGSGAGKDGNWWYKHGNTGAACTPNDTTGLSGATANLTGLSPNNGYTYQAFSDSNCTAANLLATAKRFTTIFVQHPGDRDRNAEFNLRGCRQKNKRVIDWSESGECGRWGMAAAHRRHDMSDAVWERLGPYLSGGEGKQGRPAHDNRRFIDAVCRILRTGAPWRDLPPDYGALRQAQEEEHSPPLLLNGAEGRWRDRGEWARLLEAVMDDPDFEGLMIDASYIKAHPHSAGARGGSQAIARTKGG